MSKRMREKTKPTDKEGGKMESSGKGKRRGHNSARKAAEVAAVVLSTAGTDRLIKRPFYRLNSE